MLDQPLQQALSYVSYVNVLILHRGRAWDTVYLHHQYHMTNEYVYT